MGVSRNIFPLVCGPWQALPPLCSLLRVLRALNTPLHLGRLLQSRATLFFLGTLQKCCSAAAGGLRVNAERSRRGVLLTVLPLKSRAPSVATPHPLPSTLPHNLKCPAIMAAVCVLCVHDSVRELCCCSA